MEAKRLQAWRWAGLDELRPTVRAHLRRFSHDDAEIDDAVQDALVRAARYRESLTDGQRLQPWLLRIALNVLRDHRRREARLPRCENAEQALSQIEGREHAPGEVREPWRTRWTREVAERQRLIDHLDSALGDLREGDRGMLQIYYECDRSSRLAGEASALAPSLVKARAFRARKRLVALLVGRLEHDPELPAIKRDELRARGAGRRARRAQADAALAARANDMSDAGGAPGAPDALGAVLLLDAMHAADVADTPGTPDARGAVHAADEADVARASGAGGQPGAAGSGPTAEAAPTDIAAGQAGTGLARRNSPARRQELAVALEARA